MIGSWRDVCVWYVFEGEDSMHVMFDEPIGKSYALSSSICFYERRQ